MAIGRAYPIKKNAVKAYGYTRPPSKKRSLKRNGPRFAANGSVTHIAAINGRGSYRSARRTMSGLRANRRPAAARSSLSAAKKAAFAREMRAAKGKGGSSKKAWRKGGGPVRETSFVGGKRRVKTYKSYGALKRSRMKQNDVSPAQERIWERSAARHRDPWGSPKRKTKSKKAKAPTKTRRRKTVAKKKATRKTPMARKVRRRKKSAARSTPKRRVAKRRTVKRRRKAAKRSAAPKRKRRKSRAKTTLKANRRRRHRKNYGTSIGAKRGWKTRRANKSAGKRKRRLTRKTAKRRRSRKASAVSPKRRTSRRGKRKLSMKKSAVAARRRRRAAARGGLKKNRRHRRSRRHTANRRRRSHRRHASNPRRRRRSTRRMSSNRRRRSHRSNRRRSHRRNGRRMFKKNGVGDTLMFIGKTGGIALLGFVAHKLVTNLLVTQIMGKIFGTPAVVVPVSVPATATTPATTTAAVVAPATAGLGLINLDPAYQQLIGAGVVAGLGVFAAAKLIKDPGTRNTVMTGIAVSFTTSLFTAALMKFAPTHAGMLAGDGTAARLSAMYGLGAGTSLQPRYSSIGRSMGEYFSSGTNGLGEYFSSGQGTSGLGEYFSSGMSGLGLPAYEAAAGYGANPDFAEAAAGMGAREAMNTNHVDPHGDLDRELTIAEAAAGVGALPSYEAAAGFGDISTLPSADTWIPGSSNGQIWAGTRSISSPQSASEMVPAGILQTDGGQGVFG